MTRAVIRAATPVDVAAVQSVDVAAGRRFVEAGLPQVAADEPPRSSAVLTSIEAGELFVAVDGGEVIGFVLVEELDGAANVAQVSVLPDRQGRGVGRALVDRAAAWGVTRGLCGLTLTTFRDVAFNRPLYEHLGFRVLAPHEVTPGLADELAHTARFGAPRVAMRRELPA